MICHGYATGFHLFHKWGTYEPPKQVEEAGYETVKPTIAQRRECTRCGAVDYRRVTIHN